MKQRRKRSRLVASALSAIGVAVLVAPTSLPPAIADTKPVGHSPPYDLLLEQFEAIAFSAEYGGAYRRGRIVKWVGPIRVRIRGRNIGKFVPEVERTISELARLSGLSIRIGKWPGAAAPPNMTIHFTARHGKRGFDPKAPCRTIFHDRRFVIRRVEIYIAPENPARRRHCIVEELTQALGLSDDSTVFKNSIFNDSSRLQALAPWDALMVRLLYDPRVKPGMTRKQAMPLVERALNDRLNATARRRAMSYKRKK